MMEFALSLEMIDLDHQEPNRNKRESKYYWDELFKLVTAGGFKTISLPYQPKWMFGGRSGIPFNRHSALVKYGSVSSFFEELKTCGVDKVVNMHFDPTLFIGENLDGYFGAFGHFGQEAIEYAAESGISNVVLTPTPCRGILEYFCKEQAWDTYSAGFMKRTAELINGLDRVAQAKGVTLCVKNEFWSMVRGDLVDGFLAQLSSSVMLDIDTANLVIAGLDPVSFIKAHAEKIGSVTFTDTAFVDDGEYFRRINPEFPADRPTQVFRDIGQGNVDFAAVYQALNDIGYQGVIVCYCRQTRDPMRAILRTRYHIEHAILKA